MAHSHNPETFSRHRLGGEPVPEDVAILLAHADQLAERTGIVMSADPDWSPWLDTSYLSAADRANPDVTANCRALADVCGLIAFVAADEEDQYFGYWRGPGRRAVAHSPLVFFDNEGQFDSLGGLNFAEAVLARVGYDPDQFAELRDWFRSLGIPVRAEMSEHLQYSEEALTPEALHRELYTRYRREAGLD